MNVHDQVDELSKQAITLLLEERQRIDAKLAQFGYVNGEPITTEKKNGRTVRCSRCQGEGHTIRTCKLTPAEKPA